MGGGAVLRTSAKVAGVGVASAGRRGMPGAPPAEQPVRQASRPVSAALSSGGVKSADAAPLHTAASWDFAHDDGLVMEAGEPTPRVVFGEVPSIQEAKAAVLELKTAIDNLYLSSDSSVCEGSTGSDISVQSPLLSGTETKPCVIKSLSTPSVPKRVLQIFKSLSTDSEVQTAVASVARDRKVWNSVMQNPEFKQLLQSHQTAAGVESEESPEILEKLHHPDQKSSQGNGFVRFMEKMQNLKVTVTEMVGNVSKYFNDMFGLSEEEKSSSGVNGNTGSNFMDNTLAMGGTIMGLAVLVIMVVLLKRA